MMLWSLVPEEKRFDKLFCLGLLVNKTLSLGSVKKKKKSQKVG